MKIKKELFILLLLFFILQRAFMSQVGFIHVSLHELIKASDAALIVTKNDPFETIKKIIIFSLPWKKCSPYNKYIHNYKIENIIFNKKKILFEQNIKVIDAYFESDLSIYKEMCRKNIGISVVYKKYETSINLKNENKFIIFIKETDKKEEYQYTVKSAFESEKYLLKIKKILH